MIRELSREHGHYRAIIGVVGPRPRFFNLLGEPSLIWT